MRTWVISGCVLGLWLGVACSGDSDGAGPETGLQDNTGAGGPPSAAPNGPDPGGPPGPVAGPPAANPPGNVPPSNGPPAAMMPSGDPSAMPDGGTGDAGTQPAAPAELSECDGKPLPPRARSQQRRFQVGPAQAGLEPYWPTSGWRNEEPAALGFDPAKLAAAVDFTLPGASSQAVLVVRHGYVAAEKYFGSFRASSKHESFSMAKSFSSALVGIAIGEGKLTSTDDRICMAYSEWDCDDMNDPRSRITIEHAMNLSTGLRWSENWRSDVSGTNDAFSFNMLATALARPAVEEPGTSKRYSTGDPALLTGPLQQATGMTALAYAREKVFNVIGTPDISWNSDSSGRTTTYAGLQATAIDYAKFGYLYLNRGMWDGQQVVPEAWVERTTVGAAPCDDWYQWLWHVNMPVRLGPQDPACRELYCPPADFADLPGDGFFAEGINGQFIFIVPSADLVVVRLAQDGSGSENWDNFARGFMLAMLDAISDP